MKHYLLCPKGGLAGVRGQPGWKIRKAAVVRAARHTSTTPVFDFPCLFCLSVWKYTLTNIILDSLAAGRIICGPLWGYNIALVPAARRSWKRRADRINKTTGDDTGTPRWRHNIAKPCNSILLTSSKKSFLRGSSNIYLHTPGWEPFM